MACKNSVSECVCVSYMDDKVWLLLNEDLVKTGFVLYFISLVAL